MITIEQISHRYKVKFSNPGSGSRGFSTMVKDLSEIHIVIDHYYAQKHDHRKCPFCQRNKEEVYGS